MTKNPVSVEYNLENSIVVTPVIVNLLKTVLVDLDNDQDFICNSILHPRNATEDFAQNKALQEFIMRSISIQVIDGEVCESVSGTLYGWLCFMYEPFNIMESELSRQVAHMAREAWVAKMLYLIEEKDAVRLYSDGSYLDADWRYLPNGEPGWMRGDLPQ